MKVGQAFHLQKCGVHTLFSFLFPIIAIFMPIFVRFAVHGALASVSAPLSDAMQALRAAASLDLKMLPAAMR